MKNIIQVDKNLFILRLLPPILGFENFIGVWLYKSRDFNMLIDVGPAVTVNQLVYQLAYLGIKTLNYIVLTHIHIDHAGAIGKMARVFDGSLIVCHESAIPNLINPSQLWKGSLLVLDIIAKAYGKPIPIQNNILHSQNNMIKNIKILETPGHSPHHISLLFKHYIFLGEAAGVLFKTKLGEIYMRPATPPIFF